MTISELSAMYKRCYRIIQKERMWRVAMKERALGESKVREWEGKIAEMDGVLADLTAMKDALKATIPGSQPVYQQDALLDIPPVIKSY